MKLVSESYYLAHHGIKGQKWGVRRYRNADGSLTRLGKLKVKIDKNARNEYISERVTAEAREVLGDAHDAKQSHKNYLNIAQEANRKLENDEHLSKSFNEKYKKAVNSEYRIPDAAAKKVLENLKSRQDALFKDVPDNFLYVQSRLSKEFKSAFNTAYDDIVIRPAQKEYFGF